MNDFAQRLINCFILPLFLLFIIWSSNMLVVYESKATILINGYDHIMAEACSWQIIWNNKPRKILCEYPQIRPKTTKNVIAVTYHNAATLMRMFF